MKKCNRCGYNTTNIVNNLCIDCNAEFKVKEIIKREEEENGLIPEGVELNNCKEGFNSVAESDTIKCYKNELRESYFKNKLLNDGWNIGDISKYLDDVYRVSEKLVDRRIYGRKFIISKNGMKDGTYVERSGDVYLIEGGVGGSDK